jgi:hypothetical protein
MRRLLLATALVAAGVTACTSGHAAAPPGTARPIPVVGCRNVIGRSADPFTRGYRRVLGVVAAPAAYTPQVVRNSAGRWPWWEKAAMLVRAGRTAVTISVPAAWRRRAAITWGNGLPAVSALRIAPCPSPAGRWNAYAGGFLMSTRGACIPLTFSVGDRRKMVRFGIHRRCPA